MKNQTLLITVACAGLLGSCATAPPTELVNARAAYHQASQGPAAQVAQAELHVANKALAQAEESFRDTPDSYKTLDLSYVAQRKPTQDPVDLSLSSALCTVEEPLFEAARFPALYAPTTNSRKDTASRKWM